MALLDDLLGATAPAEILRHVAGATWARAYDSAECPDKRIPDPEVLATWLPECPDAARDEAAALLAPLFEARPTAWQRVTFDGAPTLYAFIQVDEARPGMLAVPDGAGGYVPVIGADLDYVHEKWCAHPAPRPRHPLASVEHRDHGRRGDGPDPRRGDGDGFNVQHGRWAEHAAATLGIRVAMMAVVAVATGCSVPLP